MFHIVHEESRKRVENPAEKVLRMGHVVGLADHTRSLRATAPSGRLPTAPPRSATTMGTSSASSWCFREIADPFAARNQAGAALLRRNANGTATRRAARSEAEPSQPGQR